VFKTLFDNQLLLTENTNTLLCRVLQKGIKEEQSAAQFDTITQKSRPRMDAILKVKTDIHLYLHGQNVLSNQATMLCLPLRLV